MYIGAMTGDRYSLLDSLGFWVNSLALEMRTTFERRLAPYDVTAPQWAVLITLYRDQAETPKELAEFIGIDGSAVTRLLDRLEAKGLIAREPHGSDRRSVRVALTREGRALTPQLVPISRRANAEFLERLAPDEQHDLHRLIIQMLREAPGS